MSNSEIEWALLNIATALIGPPTSLILIYIAYIKKSKIAYIGVGLVALGGLIYYLYLYFSDAKNTDTETQITGNPNIAQTSYIINAVIEILFIIYCFIGYRTASLAKPPPRSGSVASDAPRQAQPRSGSVASVAPRPAPPSRK